VSRRACICSRERAGPVGLLIMVSQVVLFWGSVSVSVSVTVHFRFQFELFGSSGCFGCFGWEKLGPKWNAKWMGC